MFTFKAFVVPVLATLVTGHFRVTALAASTGAATTVEVGSQIKLHPERQGCIETFRAEFKTRPDVFSKAANISTDAPNLIIDAVEHDKYTSYYRVRFESSAVAYIRKEALAVQAANITGVLDTPEVQGCISILRQ